VKRSAAHFSNHRPRNPPAIAAFLKPKAVKSRYGLVRGDVVFEQQIVTVEGRGQDLSVACPRSMALCGRARGTDGSRKEAKTQRKPRTGLCDAWCGAPFFVTPIHIPTGREATGGLRRANTHRLRSVNRLSSTCVMLSREKWWVSRSVVNRADARGGIWDVEVVEGIIGRPLHHTLLNVESQQAVLSVVQCPSLLHPPRLPLKREKRWAEGIMAVDLTVLA
jgi:hypothetical protein